MRDLLIRRTVRAILVDQLLRGGCFCGGFLALYRRFDFGWSICPGFAVLRLVGDCQRFRGGLRVILVRSCFSARGLHGLRHPSGGKVGVVLRLQCIDLRVKVCQLTLGFDAFLGVLKQLDLARDSLDLAALVGRGVVQHLLLQLLNLLHTLRLPGCACGFLCRNQRIRGALRVLTHPHLKLRVRRRAQLGHAGYTLLHLLHACKHILAHPGVHAPAVNKQLPAQALDLLRTHRLHLRSGVGYGSRVGLEQFLNLPLAELRVALRALLRDLFHCLLSSRCHTVQRLHIAGVRCVALGPQPGKLRACLDYSVHHLLPGGLCRAYALRVHLAELLQPVCDALLCGAECIIGGAVLGHHALIHFEPLRIHAVKLRIAQRCLDGFLVAGVDQLLHLRRTGRISVRRIIQHLLCLLMRLARRRIGEALPHQREQRAGGIRVQILLRGRQRGILLQYPLPTGIFQIVAGDFLHALGVGRLGDGHNHVQRFLSTVVVQNPLDAVLCAALCSGLRNAAIDLAFDTRAGRGADVPAHRLRQTFRERRVETPDLRGVLVIALGFSSIISAAPTLYHKGHGGDTDGHVRHSLADDLHRPGRVLGQSTQAECLFQPGQRISERSALNAGGHRCDAAAEQPAEEPCRFARLIRAY